MVSFASKTSKMKEIGFTQMVSVGCGKDVRQSQITASIRKSDDDVDTRQFEAYTNFLTSLREWCKKCKNGTWQQSFAKHTGRMRLGSYPQEGLLFETQVWKVWLDDVVKRKCL